MNLLFFLFGFLCGFCGLAACIVWAALAVNRNYDELD